MESLRYQTFFKRDEPYGWGSNFYKLENGVLINGERWNDTETYFQAMKFRGKNSSDQDLEYSKLFLKVDSPMKAKALGNQKPLIRFMTKLVLNKNNDQRKINDLIQEYKNKVKIRDDWEKVKFHVMTEGIINKFAQYKDLKKQLKEIPDNMLLVEHSKRDKVWSDGGDGGTGEKGTNYMGKILTALSWIIKY